MSYSFTVKAATKAEAKSQAKTEFDKVIEFKPVHARDKDAALAAMNANIDLLGDDDSRDVYVSCSGHVAYDWSDGVDPSTIPLTSVSFTCGASLIARESTAQ